MRHHKRRPNRELYAEHKLYQKQLQKLISEIKLIVKKLSRELFARMESAEKEVKHRLKIIEKEKKIFEDNYREYVNKLRAAGARAIKKAQKHFNKKIKPHLKSLKL